MPARWLLGLVLVGALGCGGGPKLAPVSGTVTMDGSPLVGATVSFLPVSDPAALESPLGSTGKTNEKGEYALETLKQQKGALAGKHQVSITRLDPQIGQGDERPPRGGWPTKDMIPARYNEKTELTFDVPPSGTTKADFQLKSR